MKKLISTLVITSMGLSSLSLMAEELKKSPERPKLSVGDIIKKKSHETEPDLVDQAVQDYIVGKDKSRDLFEAKFRLQVLKSFNDSILEAIETAKFENDLAESFGFTDADDVVNFEISGNTLAIIAGVGLKGYQLRSFFKFLKNDPKLAAAMERHSQASADFYKAKVDLFTVEVAKNEQETKISHLQQNINDIEREGPIGTLAELDDDLRGLASDVKNSELALKEAEKKLASARSANSAMLDYTELNPNFLADKDSPYTLDSMDKIESELRAAEKNLKTISVRLNFLKERMEQVTEQRVAREAELAEKTKTLKNQIRGHESHIKNSLVPEIERLTELTQEKELALKESKGFLRGTRLKKWTTRFLAKSMLGVATTAATVPLVIVSSNDLAENIQIKWGSSEDEPVDLFAVNEFKNYLMTISSELEAEIAEIENLENDYYMQMSKKPKVYDLGE